MSNRSRPLLAIAAMLLALSALTACGDTWRGAKQDTSDNLKTTGQAVEKAGQKVEP